jgi:virginiamycin B lyase
MKVKSLLNIFILVTVPAFLFASDTVSVSIKEYRLPTPNSFPHDPALGPDGSLWYTGMGANTLGRLNTTTGEIKEYRLEVPSSGPHGLVADKEGNIWFTANFKGYIGRMDPETGKVTSYKLPAAAHDPHTPVFDGKGMLWFTVQQGNMVGRLNPKTGEVLVRSSPSPDSLPYGIAVNSKGIPFFCELGSNKLASVDPDTMSIKEYPLPVNARPRRLAIAADDIIYFSDYASGQLGRFNPSDGKVIEWASPGGPASKPYGIAITPDGKVWYSESGITPNTIVRFDPAAESFLSWKIPSGGGVVRNMVATPGGNLYLACSGKNKVAIVQVNK